MLAALAAGIQPLEEVDVAFQRGALVFGRLVREARHDGVEVLPGRAAEFCFGGLVAEFGHDGVAIELLGGDSDGCLGLVLGLNSRVERTGSPCWHAAEKGDEYPAGENRASQ